jgi:hypothetical protein
MPNADPHDPLPVPCVDVPVDPTPPSAPDHERVRAPAGDLPDLATRIEEAQRQARERRIEQGLPAEADDGSYTLKRPRKHAAKRSKKHGQFLGTVCDSWEDKTRGR